jgi:hypothetical protein
MFAVTGTCAFEVLLVTGVYKSTYLAKKGTVNAIRILPIGTFIFGRWVLPTSKAVERGRDVDEELFPVLTLRNVVLPVSTVAIFIV